MDPSYRFIYEQLYTNFARGLPRGTDDLLDGLAYTGRSSGDTWDEQGRGSVVGAIERADRAIRPHLLRADAKALLALNFYNLVLVPLRAAVVETVDQDIDHDISMLVRTAAEASHETEISAHTVLDALSSNWQNLATGRHQLWQQS